ncbi:hypothetical protein DP939_40955 [Spongiactinospora rosea]|uniref:Uncharacterized protein n=1 Tax=Spongiactinospora rosea TaxID=2248750 RepID=A0A366LME0_9ACTN|nr:hypothetical protein DP939_40955 [Spongiactinospora rosea]
MPGAARRPGPCRWWACRCCASDRSGRGPARSRRTASPATCPNGPEALRTRIPAAMPPLPPCCVRMPDRASRNIPHIAIFPARHSTGE